MSKYLRIQNIMGWCVFAFSTMVYLLTMESSSSLWDCGEFIAAAQKLQVVHPPGAPLFLMIARMFTLFAGGNPELVAITMNAMSAILSGLSMMFLFWIAVYMAKRLLVGREGSLSGTNLIVALGAGVITALSATFTSSIWFSAVEGEVYAMSLFLTALIFWLACKWDQHANEPYADKYLMLIAFLMGCSIFVHWLNLLAIPALAFIYYFRRYDTTNRGMFVTLISSFAIIIFIIFGVITGWIDLITANEINFVNNFGLPFNTGLFVSLILWFIGIVSLILFSSKDGNKLFLYSGLGAIGLCFLLWLMATDIGSNAFIKLIKMGLVVLPFYLAFKSGKIQFNNLLWSLVFVMIGYSTIVTVVIRSNSEPNIDMNSPRDIVSLSSYLHRDQYGSRPLLTGYFYTDQPTDIEITSKKYQKGNEQYDIVGDRFVYKYGKSDKKFFPRIYEPDHKGNYERWLGLKKNQKPTYFDNIKFFVKYQLGFMYFRYLFWNFVGKQNDEQGFGAGDYENGNWISGIGFLDAMRLGDQSELPDSSKNDASRNVYFFIPLLIAILGLSYQLTNDKRRWIVVFLLFSMTGIALIIYGNSPPIEPRERDYIFAGSFWTFCIWIGLGVLAIYNMLKTKMDEKPAAYVAIAICSLAPILMGMQNWDDHNRNGRTPARDFATNYLESCAPNSILFTQGDNDTYPLWYAQEVEGVRTDIRIVNLSLLGVDWYINQLRRKVNDADPVPMSMSSEDIRGSRRDLVSFVENPNIAPTDRYIKLKEIVEFIGNDANMQPTRQGDKMAYFPTQKFSIPIDKNKVIANGIVQPGDAALITDVIQWDMPKSSLYKHDLMVLDIISSNNWERPIYFAISVDRNSYLGLEKYFQLEGLTYQLVPIPVNKGQSSLLGRVQSDVMYQNIMNKFGYGNITEEGTYVDNDMRRMLYNFRNVYVELADQLNAEGKKDKAVEVLDKCQEDVFYNNMVYDYYLFTMIVAYYESGAYDKGNDLMIKVASQMIDEMDHYKSNADNRRMFKHNIERNDALLNQLARMAKGEGQAATADKLKEIGGKYLQ